MAAEAMAVLWEKMAAGEQVEFVASVFVFGHPQQSASLFEAREPEISDTRKRRIGCFPGNTVPNQYARSMRPACALCRGCANHSAQIAGCAGRQTRRVFMLSRFEGMSNRQIAQELGISEKSVEYHVTKALKQLRTDLKDYLPLIYLFLGI